jgi:hypothetical protein
VAAPFPFVPIQHYPERHLILSAVKAQHDPERVAGSLVAPETFSIIVGGGSISPQRTSIHSHRVSNLK